MESYYEDNDFLTFINPEAYGESTGNSTLLGSQSLPSNEMNSSSQGLSPNTFNFLQPNGSPSSLSSGNLNEMNLFEPLSNSGLKQDYSLNFEDCNQFGQPFVNPAPDFQLKPEHFELLQAYRNQQAFYSNNLSVDGTINSNPLTGQVFMNSNPLDLLNFSQVVADGNKNEKRGKKKSKKVEANIPIQPLPILNQPGMPVLAPKPVNNSEVFLPFINKLSTTSDITTDLELPAISETVIQPVKIQIPIEPRRLSESAEAYRTKTLLKKNERLIRNRQSAQISRQKKKEHVHALETENKVLHLHKQGLLDRMVQLEGMVRELASQVNDPEKYLTPLEDIRRFMEEVVADHSTDDMECIEEEDKPRNGLSFNSVLPLLFLGILFFIGTFGFVFNGTQYPTGYSYSAGLPTSATPHIAVIKNEIAPAVPKGIQSTYRNHYVHKHNGKVVEDIFDSKKPYLKQATLPQVYKFAHASLKASDARAQLSHQHSQGNPRVLHIEGSPSSNTPKALTDNPNTEFTANKLKRAFLYTKDLKSWLPSLSSFPHPDKPIHSEAINKLVDQQYLMTLITNWVDDDNELEPSQDKFLLLDLKISHTTVINANKLERLN